MALPVTIPNEFANATASIPLSQLDANFNTLANAVNGISDGSESLANVSVTNGNVNVSTLVVNSNNISADNSLGFRNRIINGDMRIDQRNAGAAVTLTDSTPEYTLDRWRCYETTDGVLSIQQSTEDPPYFQASLKVTVTTADASLASGQTAFVNQIIEGYNIADFEWGAATAKDVTLSFWVRSSVTGQFGGAVRNNSSRSYPFSYTINAADTWEYKTVTIPGDTTGTWLDNNGQGIRLYFSVGDGGGASATAGVWNDSGSVTATGQTNLLATLNATWYITGVQLEVGSVATPFERRPYGTELALCQRYYEKHSSATSNNFTAFASTVASATTGAEGYIQYCVSKRAAPTISISSLGLSDGFNAATAVTSLGTSYRGTESALIQVNVASGLTQFRPYSLIANNSATAYVDFSAEL